MRWLGNYVADVTDTDSEVLNIELRSPLPRHVRAYLYNATNPPGGRPKDDPEHKIQLRVPGQGPRQRANFDFSDGRAVVLAGKVEDQDAFVLWDAELYQNFAYSAGVYVKTQTISNALISHALTTQARRVGSQAETVIAAPSAILADAIALRFGINLKQAVAPNRLPISPSSDIGGTPYLSPPRTGADPGSEARVFQFDPDAVDRGTTAHMDVQDALAAALEAHGLSPLSPRSGDPQFDIAWVDRGVAYITEVKSLTDDNETSQLRLGLGQVLSYVHLLNWSGVQTVRGVLAVERQPKDEYWMTLCLEHDVVLTWPEIFDDLAIDSED